MSDLKCDRGRDVGCRTFCCRLLVRLTPEEKEQLYPGEQRISMDKSPDGYCEKLDRTSWKCTIWEERPQACRAFDCREDERIQMVIKEQTVNIVTIAQMIQKQPLPPEEWIAI